MHDDPTLPLNEAQRAPADLALARDRWGEFKLLARVGHGGFGEVYRAWDPSLEREVALKLLLPTAGSASQSDEEYKAMLREARRWRRSSTRTSCMSTASTGTMAG